MRFRSSRRIRRFFNPGFIFFLCLAALITVAATATGGSARVKNKRRVENKERASREPSSNLGATAAPLAPNVITVNSTADSATPGDSQCTLREAITNANNDSDTTGGDCAAGSGSDTIVLNITGTITLSGALPDISSSMRITGPGADQLEVRGDQTGLGFRVFNVTSAATNVNITGLTVNNGSAAVGGGINNAGTLVLQDCAIGNASTTSGNLAASSGGGINNSGTLTVERCTISNNVATALGGGGIYNDLTGNLTVKNSTISSNTSQAGANTGGGIRNDGGMVTLINVTIAEQSSGGGVSSTAGTTNLDNTLVAKNTTASDQDLSGTFHSNDYNLIENKGTAVFDLTSMTTHDQVGTSGSPLDAKLRPFFNYGGPTYTYMLLPTSPAVNAGNNTAATNAGLTTDQRGANFARIVNTTVDIGAVETNYTIEATAGTPQTAPPNTAFATQLQATVKESGVIQSGINVTFTAPATGASGTFQGSGANVTVNTDSNGVATAPTFTANGTAGSYTVTASISTGLPTATFSLTNNTPPVALNQQVTTNEDTAKAVTLTGSDADGDSLAFTIINNPQHGTLSGTAPNLTYTPAANYFGSDSFTFKANDGRADSAQNGTVSIIINPVADTPSVTNATTTISTKTKTGLVISRNDADGAEVTYFKITNIQNGVLFKNDGVTQIINGNFITYAEGHAGLKFTPSDNHVSPGTTFSFDVQAAINNSGGGLSSAATATITVNCGTATVITNSQDSGAGSLREVITNACPGDTITFDPALTSGGPATITLTSDELLVNRNLTIQGPGASLLTVRRSAASGTPQFRIFEIKNATVNISGMTISGGDFGGGGAGIFNNFGGTLTLTDTIVSGNNDNNFGGGGISNSSTLTLTNSTVSGNTGNGIRNTGPLTLINSKVSGNVGSGISSTGPYSLSVTNSIITGNSTGSGGGILMSGGTLTLTNSTVSGNTATFGGGIFTGGGTTGDTLILANSTVSGNTATSEGGGILTAGTVTMTNCTVSGNTANSTGGGIYLSGGGLATASLTNCTVSSNSASLGGGIDNVLGRANLKNTIIADNVTMGGSGPDLAGTFNSQDYNLIGNTSGATFTGTTAHNIINQRANLGALANNGGPTRTMLPLPGSPAIDAGGVVTTLNGAVDNSQTTITLTDATAFPAGVGFVIQIDNEQMIVTAKSSNTLTVARGANSTIAAAHANDTGVNPAFDQRGAGFNRITNTTVDIGAVETNYSISAAAGTGQSATINTPFSTQLQASVTESGNPLSSIPVTFTPPATGASGTFSTSATITTNASGVATAPVFTANGTAGGPYNVVASIGAGLPAANFALTNLKGNQTISFGALANRTFGDADFNLSASASSGLTVAFAASGNCTVTGNTAHLTGAGTCTITASQTGDSNYLAATSIGRSFTVGKGTATITLSNLTQSYDGTVRSATASTNPSGLNVTFTYSQNGTSITSPTLVGAYNVTATIDDTNYQGNTSGILVINKGTPVIAWSNPSNITFGTALSNTQLNASANVSGIFQYNPPAGTILSVGNNQLTVTFTPTDTANYTTAQRSVQLIVVAPANAINLSSTSYSVGEGDGNIAVVANRTGDASFAATVDYTTSDAAGLQPCDQFNGIASSRCDYATTVGTLRFAAGETTKTIFIPIVDDSYSEGNETFTITLSNPVGESLGSITSATITITDNDSVTGANPLLDQRFFIRQQYIDFLGREPDPVGFAGWLDVLNNCGTKYPTPCDRIEVSGDFFRSPEFQDRGYFIYRFYATIGRHPFYSEFMPDLAKVSGFLSDAQLEANKAAYVQEFMARTEFQTMYGSLTDPTAYVDALLRTVGLQNHPTRATWISALTNQTMTRAQVLRALVESAELYNKYYNEAFVVMQYFGYLRRDPDILYLQWIDTMNKTGDYRTMINGFMNSSEYFRRFGP